MYFNYRRRQTVQFTTRLRCYNNNNMYIVHVYTLYRRDKTFTHRAGRCENSFPASARVKSYNNNIHKPRCDISSEKIPTTRNVRIRIIYYNYVYSYFVRILFRSHFRAVFFLPLSLVSCGCVSSRVSCCIVFTVSRCEQNPRRLRWWHAYVMYYLYYNAILPLCTDLFL